MWKHSRDMHYLFVVTVMLIIWAIFIPVSIIVLLPLFAFRFFIAKIGPLLNKDLGNMLTAEGSFWNQDRMNLGATFHVDGNLNIDLMRKVFLERVILLRNENGELKYPELQQYHTRWFGFSFWKWDRNFKIENHIRLYDTSQYKTHDDFIKSLAFKKFPSGKSPWHIYLLDQKPKTNFPNDEEIVSTVVTHTHHSMIDGYSILSILFEALMGKKLQPSEPTEENRITAKRIAKCVHFLFSRSCLLFMDSSKFFDSNEWHQLNWKTVSRNFKPDFHVSTSGFIPMKLLKAVQDKYQVCRSTVIFFAVTGALRKLMINKSIKLPETIRLWHPDPRPGHPDTLRNHFDLTEINLPIGKSNYAERLDFIKHEVIKSKDGIFQLAWESGMKLLGSLPHFLMCALRRDLYSTVAFSRMACLPSLTLFDTNVLHFNICSGVPDGNKQIGMYFMGYRDYLYMSILIDKDLVTAEETNQMFAFINHELEIALNNMLDYDYVC